MQKRPDILSTSQDVAIALMIIQMYDRSGSESVVCSEVYVSFLNVGHVINQIRALLQGEMHDAKKWLKGVVKGFLRIKY